MKIYLNAGFGDPLGQETLRLINVLGFSGVRQDITTDDAEKIQTLVGEFASSPLKPIFLVGHGYAEDMPQRLAARAAIVGKYVLEFGIAGAAIEMVNEPDLSQMYRRRPDYVAQLVRMVTASCPGVRVVIGGVCGVTRSNVDYIRKVIASGVPDDVVLGVHTYRRATPLTPPDTPCPGFSSRQEEMDALRTVAQGHDVWCTEVGWSTETVTTGFWIFSKKKRLTDEQVAINLRREFSILKACGLDVATLFQIHDGITDQERWGIMRADGTLKPSATIAGEAWS